MKGLVRTYEIIDEAQKDILCEPNLIADGAGEHIVDILTTSFVLSGDYENTYLSSFSGILDTSNFVIQAGTFGNSYEAYQSNLLAYKKHNFAPNSSSLSGTGWNYINVSSDENNLLKVTNTASITPEVHATAAVQLTSIGDYLSSAMSGVTPITASIDVKFNFDDPIEQNGDTGKRYTSFQMLHWGTSSTINIEWNGGIPSFTDSHQDGYIKNMLGGWYRVSLRTQSDLSGSIEGFPQFTEKILFSVFPAGDTYRLDDSTGSNAGGSLYVRNPSVNLGSIPVNYYVETGDAFYGYEDDVLEYPLLVSSIVSASGCGIHVINSSGTTTNDTSSYNEVFGLPEDPNPIDTKLQSNTETPYSQETALKVNVGHNVNFALWEGESVSSTEFLDYLEEDWSYGSSIPSSRIHEDIRFYSSYAPSSAGSFSYVLLSSMDYTTPVATYTPPVSVFTVNALPDNESVRKAVNHEGYIRVAYPTENIAGSFKFPSDLSSTAGFLSATYEVSPSAGAMVFDMNTNAIDARWMSMTGGVQALGLYVFDFKEMMRRGYSFPFDFENKDQPPIYKLFAKKVFHVPFAHVGDYINSPTFHSGWTTLTSQKGYQWRITI